MAGSKLLMMMVFIVMVIASFQLHSTVAQTTRHVVGDTFGWNIPTGNTNYTTWASGQTFNVGESLFFNFTTGFHDVAEVSEEAYGPCTTTNTINMITTGPATITLNTTGNHYYICTFGTHCRSGQKVTINVVNGTSGSTPPSTNNTTSPPPPPPSPSSGSCYTAVVPVTFLAAALAFFY